MFAWDSVPNCVWCGSVHKGNANEGFSDIVSFESCQCEGIIMLQQKRAFSNLKLDFISSVDNFSLYTALHLYPLIKLFRHCFAYAVPSSCYVV